MKTLTILKGVAAVALLTSFGAAANAAHIPSPCQAGEPGAGTNCIYLVLNGTSTPAGGYNSATGDRADTSASLTYGVDVYIDFSTTDYTGGGFSITFNPAADVTSSSFAFDAGFDAGGAMFSSTGSYTAGFGHTDIQINSPSGYNSLALVGTMTVTVASAGLYDFSVIIGDENGAYATNTFPSCFSDVNQDPNNPSCGALGLYNLTVQANAVPLPAAVWMMLAGLGSLAGFARRKS